MLEVNVEKIMPVTEARDALNKIVDEVAADDELYVLTVNGKPSAVLVGVHHLEKLTGAKEKDLVNATAETASMPTPPASGGVAPAPVDEMSSAPIPTPAAPTAGPFTSAPAQPAETDLFAENASAVPALDTVPPVAPAIPPAPALPETAPPAGDINPNSVFPPTDNTMTAPVTMPAASGQMATPAAPTQTDNSNTQTPVDNTMYQ